MASQFNPYAAPKSATLASGSSDFWREGDKLVCRPDGVLPARCVKCNQPAEQPMKVRTLYWHHPAWYLLILINIVVYAIVALIVRRKATVALGLCEGHRRRRTRFLWIGWGGFILGLALMVGGGAYVVIGLVLILVAITAGLSGARLVYPQRITKEEVRLKGCDQSFLDTIPERG